MQLEIPNNKLKKEVTIESIMKFNKRQTPEILYGEKIDFQNDLFLNNDQQKEEI